MNKFKVGDKVLCYGKIQGIINATNGTEYYLIKSIHGFDIIYKEDLYKIESVRIISDIDPYGEEDWSE